MENAWGTSWGDSWATAWGNGTPIVVDDGSNYIIFARRVGRR